MALPTEPDPGPDWYGDGPDGLEWWESQDDTSDARAEALAEWKAGR